MLDAAEAAALVQRIDESTAQDREKLQSDNTQMVEAAVEAATAEARSNLKRDMGMIAEASDGLEPIMSIETISGEDLDHKMKVVLGEACSVMRKALREVTTPEERERIEGDLLALKDELRVGVRTIWEAAVAERDRLEKEAQAAMEKSTIKKSLAYGKAELEALAKKRKGGPIALAVVTSQIQLIHEEAAGTVRADLAHTLEDTRVDAAVAEVALHLDTHFFAPFIAKNIQRVHDTINKAISHVVSTFPNRVNEALGRTLPVSMPVLTSAIAEVERDLALEVETRLSAFATTEDMEEAAAAVVVGTKEARQVRYYSCVFKFSLATHVFKLTCSTDILNVTFFFS